MNEELKPCPFCGGPAEVQAAIDWPGHQQVTCQSCAANTFGTRCVERWNARPPGPEAGPSPDVEARLKRLEAWVFGKRRSDGFVMTVFEHGDPGKVFETVPLFMTCTMPLVEPAVTVDSPPNIDQ